MMKVLRSDVDILDAIKYGYVNDTATYTVAGIVGFQSQVSDGIFASHSVMINPSNSLASVVSKKQFYLESQIGYNTRILSSVIGLPSMSFLGSEALDGYCYSNSPIMGETKNVPIVSYGLKVENYIQLYYEALLKNLGFELDNSIEIVSFLLRNLTMLEPLKESKEKIANYFTGSTLKLSLYKDMEEKYEVLNILVLNDFSAEKALYLEEALFEGWFKSYYIAFDGKLLIRECPKE